MAKTRKLVSSASPFDSRIGFSRAVRVGQYLAVSGTAPIAPDDGVAAAGDLYGEIFGAVRDCIADDAGFVELLRDAVDAGASVGYLAPLAADDARAFWRSVKSELGDGRVLLAAYAGGRLAGSVQLAPVPRPNARHRAEVQKLLVLREFRGRGIGKALMAAAERKAVELGRWLLVLDTVPGQPAERLYERIGYQRAGVVPDYAEKSGGGFDPTVIFYKKLS